MSATKVFAVEKSTTVRRNKNTGAKSGQGQAKRWYVGRYGSYDYDAYVKFTPNWTDVGKIVSAVLTWYTGDGLGTTVSTTTERPKVLIRRLTDGFTEYNAPDGEWQTNDWTTAAGTSSGAKNVYPTRAENGVNNFDITAIVKAWAPSTVEGGGKATNYGIGLYGTTDRLENIDIFSEKWTNAAERPYITLTYEYGLTVPDAPTSMTPTGSVAAFSDFQGDFYDSKRPTDTLAKSRVQLYAANGTTLLYDVTRLATLAEANAAHFTHVPDSLHIVPNTTYKWRACVTDQEGQVSAWTSLVSFSFTNTAPDAPTLTPTSGGTFVNPDGIMFRGTFSDDDTGDFLLAYECQMTVYAEGSPNWDDPTYLLWNSGKRYVAADTTSFETPYGGKSLAAGTYYWRARVYDNSHAPSLWTYSTITFSSSFEQDPASVVTAIQLRPRAPWRIVIRGMGTNRGPGTVLAVLEDAKNVGASELYNSPGELHFTLPKAHPQISVIEPRQTHYAVEFRQGDGWHEVFAGLIMDFDATDTDVVFYGIDYLGLLDFIVDERYDPSNPDKAAESGGSKYVTAGKNTINYIIGNGTYGQLALAKALPDSPVGFISVGSIAAMNETLVVYSTYAPALQFIVGLLDSHRAGTGKRTRLRVRKTSVGGYEFIVQDDPGVVRDNLRLRYGELVQGYRVVAFGSDWATRIHGIGRAKDGVKVMYDKMTSGLDESVWGRFTQVRMFDGLSDANDMKRRIQQATRASSKLGKQIGLGIRSGVLQPKDGFEVCDQFPIDIEDGSVSTNAFGSGYWTCVGVTWEASAKDGKQNTTLSFQPREDSVAPDPDLLTLQPISPQAEWAIGWTPPIVGRTPSRYWLDQSTGIVYEWQSDGTYLPLQAPSHDGPLAPTLTSAIIIDSDGGAVVRLTVTFR